MDKNTELIQDLNKSLQRAGLKVVANHKKYSLVTKKDDKIIKNFDTTQDLESLVIKFLIEYKKVI